ncbi:MAG: methyltransferase [Bryobacteraceae bacterium]
MLKLGFGFWGAKALLSAVELGVFTELARGPLDAPALAARLSLHRRGVRDFLDALVALGMLERVNGHYSNTAESDLFLDRAKPTYTGGLFEMASGRLWTSWGSLTDALRTGSLPTQAGQDGGPFEKLYSDPASLRQFLSAMTGVSLGTARAIAERFPWGQYRTFADIGCAQGALPVQVALAHPHLTGIGFDLPPVEPIFREYAASRGVNGRVRFHAGSFFQDPLPRADVLVMGHILHDWDLDTKRMLLKKAHEALPKGGSLIVHEALIDDERRSNAFGLLMSLNMLVETPGGFDFTAKDCFAWMREAGFQYTSVEHLTGPDSMVVGLK